ncbi:MAG: 3,4-dihydroxy-2-butanone-4-phosphate synthase [Candidatus Sumerlaeota bacterium]|nr:3,4-dihydroxy-2-butanone-4-phosphate synthase [Candidatus Sumerlaeota bacterium]
MITTIEEGLADFRTGKMIILTDDEDRENEGDLCFAASYVTPEKINFMAKHGRGLICAATTEHRLRELGLKPLGPSNTRFGTNFYEPVDVILGTTTGISAHDRAATMRALVDPATRPNDLARPGHMQTLGAREGGVLERAGQTEGVVDLARMAGLPPAGALCEIMNDDGTMARMPQLEIFAQRHNLKIITIRDIIGWRMKRETLVKPVVTVPFVNDFGEWNLTYYEAWDCEGHVAMIMGDPAAENARGALVRVHSQCFTGDTLGSLRCDCRPQLHAAMKHISEEGAGVLLYLHQEGRGIGLKNKLLAYQKQEEGLDTVEANTALGFKPDLREYGIGAQILRDIGLRRIRLMTNNPKKIIGITGFGLVVVERVPIEVGHQKFNKRYLQTKKAKLGHMLKSI